MERFGFPNGIAIVAQSRKKRERDAETGRVLLDDPA